MVPWLLSQGIGSGSWWCIVSKVTAGVSSVVMIVSKGCGRKEEVLCGCRLGTTASTSVRVLDMLLEAVVKQGGGVTSMSSCRFFGGHKLGKGGLGTFQVFSDP